jgi:hypothetical protein
VTASFAGLDDHALAAAIATEAGRRLLLVRREFAGDPLRLSLVYHDTGPPAESAVYSPENI